MLSQLHRLQIGDRIKFKVSVLTFKALNGLGPAYLRDRLFHYRGETSLNQGQGIFGPGPSLVEHSAIRDQGPGGAEPVPQGL